MSTYAIAATKPDATIKLALAHDTIKGLFARSKTPAECSANADFYAKLSDEAPVHAQAMALASVSRAFSNHPRPKGRSFRRHVETYAAVSWIAGWAIPKPHQAAPSDSHGVQIVGATPSPR